MTTIEDWAPLVKDIARQLGRIADALDERRRPMWPDAELRLDGSTRWEGWHHDRSHKTPPRTPERPAPAPMAGPDAGRPSERRTAVSRAEHVLTEADHG